MQRLFQKLSFGDEDLDRERRYFEAMQTCKDFRRDRSDGLIMIPTA